MINNMIQGHIRFFAPMSLLTDVAFDHDIIILLKKGNVRFLQSLDSKTL